MTTTNLGIKRIEAIHYYVRDLDRSRAFYTEALDFQEIGKSSDELEKGGGQRSLLFKAANVQIVCSEPARDDSRAGRWLSKHPDGVGTIIFEVSDIEDTFKTLVEREATPISDIETTNAKGGTFHTFSITTPFGSTTFRFVQRDGFKELFPGFEMYENAQGGSNEFAFTGIDHITSNFETLAPAILWMKHVMGFEEFWSIQFHTNDVAPNMEIGSGLRSKVMWDKESGVKFANNEHLRPHFKKSQINIFVEELHGDGIQHAALGVKDILTAVRGLRKRAVKFFPTPGAYYDMLPQRIQDLDIRAIDENIDELRDLEVLIDGKGESKYLLQIFLQDAAATYAEPEAGPFFYEVIQRKGDEGFGGGNFRALFESIEREQIAAGRA